MQPCNDDNDLDHDHDHDVLISHIVDVTIELHVSDNVGVSVVDVDSNRALSAWLH